MTPLSLPKGFERLVGDLGTGTDVQRDQLVSMVTQTLAGPKTETEPTKLEYDKSQGNQTNKLIYGGRIKNFKYDISIKAESKTLSTISLLRQNQQTQCMTEPSLGFIDLNKNYFQICVQIIKIIMRVIYIPHRVINKDIWLQVEKSAK